MAGWALGDGGLQLIVTSVIFSYIISWQEGNSFGTGIEVEEESLHHKNVQRILPYTEEEHDKLQLCRFFSQKKKKKDRKASSSSSPFLPSS